MKHAKEGYAKGRVRSILRMLLLIFCVLALGVTMYTCRMADKMHYIGEETVTISSEELNAYLESEKQSYDPSYSGISVNKDSVLLDTTQSEIGEGNEILHILLIGQDRRPGESRARADAIILCSINHNTKEFLVTSFMRDMYVVIPGHMEHKLNSAFAWGGIHLIKETLLLNFGISPDAVFAIDFGGFEKVLDTLGGIDITLTAQESAYLGQMYSPGVNHLNGAAALRYSRMRSIGNGDFERTARQRNVIGAIIERCKTMGVGQLHSCLETVLPLVSTDLKTIEVLELSSKFLPVLSGNYTTVNLRIPADGTYTNAWVSDMAVLLPNLSENRKMLEKLFYGE